MHVNVPDECLERFQASERANTTRTHYHVVVALFRRREELPLTSHNDIASNIYVLHLRDTKLASKVVSTYAKCLNNQIISISVCLYLYTTTYTHFLLIKNLFIFVIFFPIRQFSQAKTRTCVLCV